MNTLLVFFAWPVATIIISIALQKILRNPALVAAIIFAIFLVVTFILNDLNFLVATIIYTILSFITATIVCLVYRIIKRLNQDENENNNNNQEEDNNCDGDELVTFETFNNNRRINVIPHTNSRKCKNY